MTQTNLEIAGSARFFRSLLEQVEEEAVGTSSRPYLFGAAESCVENGSYSICWMVTGGMGP
jgi:hypothetical protein